MTDRKQKLAAIDAALSGMFKGLEARGVPEHLANVVDQLEASAAAEASPPPEPVRPSPAPPSTPEP